MQYKDKHDSMLLSNKQTEYDSSDSQNNNNNNNNIKSTSSSPENTNTRSDHDRGNDTGTDTQGQGQEQGNNQRDSDSDGNVIQNTGETRHGDEEDPRDNDPENNSKGSDAGSEKSNPAFISLFTQLIKKSMLKDTSSAGSIDSDHGSNTSSSDNVCPICIAPFEKDDEICTSRNNECPHIFHLDCMMQWLMNNDECPLCRQDYLKQSEDFADNNNQSGDDNEGGQTARTSMVSFDPSPVFITTERLERNASFRLDRRISP